MSHKYVYLRAQRDQLPLGCAAYASNVKDGTVTYQVSMVNPKVTEVDGAKSRDQFVRPTARYLADEKIKTNPFTFKVNEVSEHWLKRLAAIEKEMASTKSKGRITRLRREFSILMAEADMIKGSTVAAVMAAISKNTGLPTRISREAKIWLRNIGEANAGYGTCDSCSCC
jgi:hypothetical protein